MKISGSVRSGRGFTFIEIIIVITIIGLLVAIAIPCSIRARDNARLSGIRQNLRQIESAKTQWAIENKKTTGDPVGSIAVLSNYFNHNSGVRDVMRETYVPNPIGTPAEADLPRGALLGTNGPVIPAD
jgi:prepilin-type N-terminal cleavage/methylation domain-containing protein